MIDLEKDDIVEFLKVWDYHCKIGDWLVEMGSLGETKHTRESCIKVVDWLKEVSK